MQDDGTGTLTLKDVVLRENQLTCTGTNCGDRDDGVAIKKEAGDLVIDWTRIVDNTTACFEDDCETGTIVRIAGGSLTIIDSLIRDTWPNAKALIATWTRW